MSLFDALSNPPLLTAVGAALLIYCLIRLRHLCLHRRARIVTVIDGDTYVAVTASGKKLRVRLFGVDCPEVGQAHADEATRFVNQAIGGRWVVLRLRGKDRYRRHLACVTYEGKDLGRELVARGLAFVLPNRPGLRVTQMMARLGGKGVWSSFFRTKPWEAESRRASRREGRKSRRF